MGIPSISERLHYRLVPGEATEPTSTIVLTSKDDHFVDIRIFKAKHAEEHSSNVSISDPECLQWAFAGKSRSKLLSTSGDAPGSRSHTVWSHWIDSKSDDPESDEGDMTVQEDGTILEEGVNIDKVTGHEEKYEELWRDLIVEPLGKKNNRHSIVLKTEDGNADSKGLVIKIGTWCQGILKTRNGLTVERWQRKIKDYDGSSEAVHDDIEEQTRTRNDWVRTFRMGSDYVPCDKVCENTSGKIGMTSRHHIGRDDELKWRVVEEYYW